jgi:hypothetical protein
MGWWWIAAAAQAGTTLPCALDHLPDGRISWTPQGVITLWQGEVRIRDIEAGNPIPATAHASCTGTKVELFDQRKGATLAFQQVSLDLGDLLATLVPADPVQLALEGVAQRVEAGDPAAAIHQLAALDVADPRVDAEWDPVLAAVGVGDVPLWDAVRAAGPPARLLPRVALARGTALMASQREAEAVREADAALAAGPNPAALLLRADARWATGDRAGAKADYEAFAKQTPQASWPETLATRCKSCKP